MRVCLIGKYFDFRGGGLGRFAMEMRDGLQRAGVEVETISAPDSAYESLVHYFNYTSVGVKSQIGRSSADVFHALTPMEGIHLPYKKSIVTIHDLHFWLYPELGGTNLNRGPTAKAKQKLGSQYFKFGCRQSAKRSEWIVTDSEMVMDQVLWNISRPISKGLKVIRPGIRPDLEPQPKPDNVFRIGYLGQLDRRKRIDLLIKAFIQSDINGELVIAGFGLDGDMLKDAVGRDHRVKFLGELPDEEICKFYNSLDWFVFPTKVEGYGLPIVEAMACKKPVVVLGDALIPDEIKEKCIRTEDLVHLLNSINGMELQDNALLESNYRFAKSHDWDKCVAEYIKLYEDIYGGSSTPKQVVSSI